MAKVLVVDDQLIGRRILEVILRSLGDDVEVLSFEDPVAALSWVKAHRVDLILTDLKMPHMDGIEFTQWLRKIPSCHDVPLIIITAHDDNKQVKRRALEAGASDFLGKPVDSAECRARCRNLLMLRQQNTLAYDRATRLEEQVRELRDRECETLLRLAKASELPGGAYVGHAHRVASNARLLAERLGMDDSRCEIIKLAAPLHDVGQLGIPVNIMMKPSSLDSAEHLIMQRHTQIGYDLLSGSDSEVLQTAATIALCHHERLDGSGYPQALKGDSIPLEAQIVGLADVLDALISERPYKPIWPLHRALEYCNQQSGIHFDPECVHALNACEDRLFKAESDSSSEPLAQ